uniref:TonB-dependent receptor n=1 Tax=Caulobacter sp. (strain K31) TaxID=366602 RepID=B0T8M7_CAUSK
MKPVLGALLIGASVAILAAAATPTSATAAEPTIALNLPAGPMQKSLVALATQADVKILFEMDLVAGLTAPALQGQFTPRQAVERLLAGSGVAVDQVRPGVLVLRPARLGASAEAAAFPGGALGGEPAQADETLLSEVVVGSHIRGAQGASPIVTFDRNAIDQGGYATLADALTALPQAFGGSVSDDTGATGADTTGVNTARATAVNLRGLGADSTLVLVDGRRMAGAGLKGDFADVSSLPLVAVERVEVLLDGASALYGSDAVGGVVNIVMRKDYEGAETRLTAGGSTRGDLRQVSIAQTFGTRWASGHALISYEHQDREALAGRRRWYAGQTDLRPWGGTDQRRYYAKPGTVVSFDPVSGALAPAYAIPNSAPGTVLRASDFTAGQNLENWRAGYDVLPAQRRDSVFLAASQDLGAQVTVSGDLRYSDRRFHATGLASDSLIFVTPDNPWYASPTNAPSEIVAYSFLDELGGVRSRGSVRSLAASVGLEARLPHDWRLTTYVAHAEDLSHTRGDNVVNPTLLDEALGATPDDPATAFSAARDGYFNPFIGQGANSRTVLDFIRSGYETRRTLGETDSFSLQADGALATLPGGPLQAAVGVQFRRERLDTGGTSFVGGTAPRAGFSRKGERTVSAGFVELRVPLVGDANRRAGIERLELSAAGRIESYDDVGTSTVPKFGLVWKPIGDLTVRGTYGRAFRAPSLGELNDRFLITPVFLTRGADTVLSLLLFGGNPELKPETAKTWTAGFDWTPQALPGLKVSASTFETRFKDRIGQPANDNLGIVLTADEFAAFRRFVDPAGNASDLALVQGLIDDPASRAKGLFPAVAYGAIADARYVNTAALTVRGVDLSARYGLSLHGDPLDLDASLTWLTDFKRQTTAAARPVDLAGQTGSPADLRLRLTATWTHGPLAATGTVNRVGDLQAETGERVASWTTVDAQVRWTAAANSRLEGLTAALSVTNLFDRDPPFYNSPLGLGYDPANADPGGRRVSLQLTKAW